MHYLLQDDDARPLMIVEASSPQDADVYGRLNLPRYNGLMIVLDADTERALFDTEGHLDFLPTTKIDAPPASCSAEELSMFDQDLALQIALHSMGLSLHPL